MNVKDLKQALENLPDDMEVIIQKDAAGNNYSPLYVYDDNSVYIPNNTYSGEVYSLNWSHEDACMGPQQWDELKNKAKSLILYPIN